MVAHDPAYDAPPAGFALRRMGGPFTASNGPYYMKEEAEGGLVLGLRIATRHLNGLGITHGGMLMAFTDTVCASAAIKATGHRVTTVRMTTDFLGVVRLGDWIEGRGRVTRATRSLVFLEATLSVRERAVLTAQAVFKLLERH